MLNLIIFGPPGTGKGTQSANIVEKYHLIHLSTGDIMREEISNSTRIGLLAKQYIDNGELVPDSVIFRHLYKRANQHDAPRGFIFDGFPRNITQAKILDQFLEKKKLPITMVICLNVDEEELFKRILHRGVHSNRSDDNEAVIRKRITVYNNQTLPLLDYYGSLGKLVFVNGMGTVSEVFAEICSRIDERLEKLR